MSGSDGSLRPGARSHMLCRAVVTAVVLELVMATAPAFAADKAAARERAALYRMQQNAMKLQAEKSALEREKGELAAKLEAATKALGAAQLQTAQTKRRVDRLDQQLPILREANTELKTKLASAEQRIVENTQRCTIETGTARQERARADTISGNLKQLVAKGDSEIAACRGTNTKLQSVAQEILARYKDKGLFDRALQAEPLTGLISVKIENIAQDYQDRLDALRVAVPAAAKTAP